MATIANTLGSVLIGGLVTHLYGATYLGIATAAMTFTILVFAEVLPKNIGIAHREALQPHVVYPLWWARRTLTPVLYVSGLVVRVFVKVRPRERASDRSGGGRNVRPPEQRRSARADHSGQARLALGAIY